MSYQRTIVRARRPRRKALGDVMAPAVPSGTTAMTIPDSTLSQDAWQSQMLTTAQQQYDFIQAFNRQYVLHGYLQLAATLCIPLAGAAWKWIFGRRVARMSL